MLQYNFLKKEQEWFAVCVLYLFPCFIYKGAAFCQVWGDISVWKVQNLKRLIDKHIWVQICDSISHIENVRHLMEEKHIKSFQHTAPGPRPVPRTVYVWPKRSSVSNIDDKRPPECNWASGQKDTQPGCWQRGTRGHERWRGMRSRGRRQMGPSGFTALLK